MVKKAIVTFDTKIQAAVRRLPRWLRKPMVAVSALGTPFILSCVAIAVAIFAWQETEARVAATMVMALVAMMANTVLKHFVHRTRPDTLYVSKMWFASSSFPSGHTFGSTVVLGLLGFFATYFWGGGPQLVAPIALGALIVTIGVSRVYLGAHYPSDVLAGWLLGGSALAILVTVFYYL